MKLRAALSGSYAIERELGQGGMATVYLAEDLKHKRRVAVKVLKPELAAVLGAERFVQEITTTASLQHPHILPLFDSGEADGFLYYVMPFIDGETLRAKLDREKQLGIDEAVRIASDVLDALHYAHEHGVIHRDIKPENILLHAGRPMVADFGIALALSAAAGGRMTETGLSLGTPHYMSPEQATAEKEISARSDVYSVGSVLYEMLTGSPPHVGATAQQIIMKIVTEEPALVTTLRRSVPHNVTAAVAKSLEKLPADRFATARAFMDALANPSFADETGGGRTRLTRESWAQRNAARVIAVGALGFAAAVWAWPRTSTAVADASYRIVLSSLTNGAWPSLVLSADGRTIVFDQSSDSGRTIWIKRADRADAEPVTGANGQAPSLSPDGAWIAFASGGRLRKVPAAGGNATTIADGVSRGTARTAWHDDGRILYTSETGDLMSVSADGTNARVVVPHDSLIDPVVSIASVPRSQTVLIVTCATNCNRSTISAVDLRSGSMSALPGRANRVWWLDGGRVAFTDRGGIFVAPFDAKSRTFTGPALPKMEDVAAAGGGTTRAALASNGTLLYEPAVAVLREPVWVNRAGMATPADSGRSYVLTGAAPTTLSADGERLVMALAGALNGTYVHDLAARTLVRQSSEVGDIVVGWDHGGRDILYGVRSRPSSSWQLIRRRTDGGSAGEPLLTNARDYVAVSGLRDSTRFLVRLGALPTRDIYLATREPGEALRLAPLLASDTYEEVSMALSPDERWIAYASNESGRFEIYVRPFPDVNAGQWRVSQEGGASPRWSHSGRELFYLRGGNLLSVAIDAGVGFSAGSPRTLFAAPDGALWNPVGHVFDISPDDRRFIFMRRITPLDQPSEGTAIMIPRWIAP